MNMENMTPQGAALVRELQDESDLCRNEGATDIANLLDKAVSALLRREWMPIETAPKDGTNILAWSHCQPRVMHWSTSIHRWDYKWARLTELRCHQPTHWQPLPDAPTGSQP